MNRLVLWCLLVVWVCGLGAGVLSQSLEGADDLSVGDRFQLNIVGDFSINRVIVPDTLTNFHVLKSERISRGTDKAWFQLTIVPLLPGSHSFPALEVEPVIPDGQSYRTDRFRLNIIPVRAENDTLLVDIKPLSKYPLQFSTWVYILLLVLFVLLIISFVLLSRKRAAQPEPVPVEAPAEVKIPPPAWKLALQKLDELLAEELVAQGETVLHHYRLSMILREFLESKYRFSAVEMTTSEIKRALQSLRVERDSEVKLFLSYCDQVKFARHTPKMEEIESAQDWLRSWLQSFEVLEAQQLMAAEGGGNAPLR